MRHTQHIILGRILGLAFLSTDGTSYLIVDVGNDADAETTLGDNVSSNQKPKAAKKRRREKHRHSPIPDSDGTTPERKRKRKKKSFDHENWQVQETPVHPQPHVPKIKVKALII